MDSPYINTGAYLREAFQALVNNLHQQLEQHGYADITPAHGWVFQYIKAEGSRITELAVHGHMTKQSMSYLVHDLEEKGYLQRQADPTDKRAVLFKLTEKGHTIQNMGRQINRDFEKNWEQLLGNERYASFREMLKVITEGISASQQR